MFGRESEFTVKATTTDGWQELMLDWYFQNVSKEAITSFDRVKMKMKVNLKILTEHSCGTNKYLPEYLLRNITDQSGLYCFNMGNGTFQDSLYCFNMGNGTFQDGLYCFNMGNGALQEPITRTEQLLLPY